ncbi:hypothetical protein LIER_19725 [Lithospermum erythrorhizon]|uniref:Uncharacterized protein n=1 Tax=Lithospermum erythrorhizon TaxID=34254 RepID=A0AAV3QLT5_LITER
MFLWSGKGEGHYHAIVAWKNLCLPLKEGGLGFKCMFTWAQIPHEGKLSRITKWVMPGTRRQTQKIMQVHHFFSALVLSEGVDQWIWGSSQLWEETRGRDENIRWGRWLWSFYGMAKFSFIVWLLMQNRRVRKTDFVNGV